MNFRFAPRFRHANSHFAAVLRLLALVAATWTIPALHARLPNIVLIVADDQGYADLGCFGGKDVQTPHLDRLAREGVRATSFYVTWPACTPSRGSILTGRYPQRNGLYDMIRNDLVNYGHRYTPEEYAVSPEMTLGMDLREITLGEVLRKAGYTTAVVGKWDGGRARRFLPLQRGFDYFYGFANTGIDYWTHERYGIPSMMRGNEPVKEEGYATDLFRREAVRFIREQHRRPFFLYLAFNAPHAASNLEKDRFQVPERFLRSHPEPRNEREANRTKYLAMITCMDEAIGEILDTLDGLSLAGDTLILFLSDNGGAAISDNGPLRGHKGDVWEGGVRVPFLARWRGVIPAGKTTDEFLTALELFPTLVHAAKARPPRGVTLDGFNMLPVLQGKTRSARSEMFWERRTDRAARVGSYKWVASQKGQGMFDLSSDPGERHDVSQERPAELRNIQARFAEWKRQMEAAEPRGPFRDY